MVHSPGRKPTGPVAPPGFERSAVGGGYLVWSQFRQGDLPKERYQFLWAIS